MGQMHEIFDQFKQQLPDIDPVETQEWVDSLDAVVQQAGPDRARFLLFRLLKRARQLQVGLPNLVQTRYINTISPEQEPYFPGDEAMEHKVRRLIRWNALAMVLRANTRFEGIGGHLSTYASAASLYEVGFNHFFRGNDDGDRRPGLLPGPCGAGHLRPRLPRGPHQRGAARPLPPRGALAGRPLLVPAPAPHARVLAVPDREHGPRPDERDLPGPLQPLPRRARAGRHGRQPRLGVPRRRRDGRAGGDRRARPRGPRGARQPHLRRQLQPPAPRRSGARQRQDHPGAGGDVPRRRVARHQGHLGARVGRPAGARRRRHPRQPHERDPRRRLPEALGRRWRVHPRALLRPRSTPQGAGRAPAATTSWRSCAVAATTTERSTPPTRPRSRTPAPRPSSSPRR